MPPFIYKKLRDKESIRLLEIIPCEAPAAGSVASRPHLYNIVELSLEYDFTWRRSEPEYETVSYVWGTAERTERLSLANGLYVMITTTLRDALPYITAASRIGFLWIDQICINQDDIEERNQQVLLMGSIYKKKRCLIWLGMADPHTHYLDSQFRLRVVERELPWRESEYPISQMGYLRHGNEQATAALRIGGASLVPEWMAIFLRPWFRRAWVFQEASLSHSALFIAEDDHFAFQTLDESLYGVIRSIETSRGVLSAEIYRGMISFMSICNVNRSMNPMDRGGPPTIQMSQLLASVAGKYDAHDPRDLVYAFMGVLSDGFWALGSLFLEPDYTLSVVRVYIDATKALIARDGNLSILQEFWYDTETIIEGVKMPSWVLVPSRLPGGRPVGRGTESSSRISYARFGDHNNIQDPERPLELITIGRVIATIKYSSKAVQHYLRGETAFLEDTNTLSRSTSAFMTTLHEWGSGPYTIQPEDLVCILKGSSVPVVLRRCGLERYSYVGACHYMEADNEIYDTEDGMQTMILV